MLIKMKLFLVGLCSLILVHEARAQQDGADLAQAEAISLQSLLQHQEALAAECAQYQALKERQVEDLLSQDEEGVHLARPLPVKVPAVCLLFMAAHDEADQRPAAPARPKLELVNWIFDEEALRAGRNGSMSKRAAGGRRGLLGEYLLDAGDLPPPDNSLEAEQPALAKFHRDVDALLADERFQAALPKSRPLIAGQLSPVILVPGLLGSRLQVSSRRVAKVNVFCSKRSDWQEVWLSLRMFLPIAVDCWLDNVRLELDPTTGQVRPPAGVEARVPDFGSVESVRHLDLRQPKLTGYFEPIIRRYEQLGYTPDKNLFAAPYDFRLAPEQLAGFFADLKELVEAAQAGSASNKKVTLLCHSMGCTNLLVFLRQQPAAWRQARIRKLIALASPWAGTAKAVKALVVGDQLDLPLVSERKMRRLARGYPSIAYLLPMGEVFARPDMDGEPGGPVLVQVADQRQYRAQDLERLLGDLGLAAQWRWFNASGALVRPLEPLADLSVDCIYSTNIQTPLTILFRNATDFPDGDYELVSGQGDGTVNRQSLAICELWARELPHKVKQTVVANTNHVGLIGHPTTLMHITDDVLMN